MGADERGKSTTSSLTSPSKPRIETEDDSLGPHGVSSHLSRLLRQKKYPKPRRTTTLSVLTASPPSRSRSLQFGDKFPTI
ncbi:hypothetical protein DY000_02029306 [Brassica cretica]|uniref:Uncharacterized protein n=1 Tax=Brassica cretica TaxID=69181 RepID=A0ABQ7DHU6_BRACR|nr:hypothetical protein DY000_02029306 [Brassica cretica]